MNVLTILQYTAPLCGIIGFIISPGLTIVYPWLREKFNKNRKIKSNELLNRKINQVDYEMVNNYLTELKTHFKFDWRPRVLKTKRKIKRLHKELKELKKGTINN